MAERNVHRHEVEGQRMMAGNRPSRLAWSLWALALLMLPGVILQLSLNWVGPTDIPFAIGFIAVQLCSATAGAVISSRVPGNAVGWIFLAIGVLLGLLLTMGAYAGLAIAAGHSSLPGGSIAAWIGSWIFVPAAFGLPMFLLLLFPDGRFVSKRWRLVGLLLGLLVAFAAVSMAFEPGLIPPGIENPLAPGGTAGELFRVLSPVADALALPGFALAVAGLVVRFRRSRGVERQQLKWFAYSAALVGLGLGTGVFIPEGPVADLAFLVGLLALAGLPVAAGIAILRFRLYDIDVIVNRTLVYGPLTVSVVATYVGSVVSLQYVLRALSGGGSQLAIVASTLAIAALFNPLRRRIQGFVDRRFYRSKYDAAKTLEDFSARLRGEMDIDSLSEDLTSVVRETLQPAHVSLWLNPVGDSRVRVRADGRG
jgi:hypothetical protein